MFLPALKGLFVFLSTFLADICWTKYTLAVAAKQAARAAWWSAGIMFLGAVVVVMYTENNAYVFYACTGAFAGTYWAVNREKKE
jgi:hypothetical protein